MTRTNVLDEFNVHRLKRHGYNDKVIKYVAETVPEDQHNTIVKLLGMQPDMVKQINQNLLED